ncbi:hypothetical protein PAEPH01_1447 [Pancytospora epiphaga]|nr:hypothetical protein PAEPH01_1447 [Pancytospora epiphaga]
MIFKKGKLVYITACAKILVATWNLSDSHNENNIEMYEAEAPMHQYIPPVPEYLELQQYENVVYNRNSYNNPMMPGTSNTEAPMYQYNPFAPEHSELQQYENRIWGYNPYNDNLMEWGFYNTEVPTGSGPVERIGHEEIKTPTSIEKLVTEFRQAEQNLNLGTQVLTDEYTRRIEEVIKEQETIESGILVKKLKEMPISEPIKEYESYDMPEQSHSSVIPQLTESSPYDYSNSTFLNKLLHSPSPFITADSIRVRLSGQFLSFLSSDQVIRVLIVLLENKLELANEDQKEFIEMIFGHIDYSLELVITKDQVVMLVEAMMRSNVSECFEQVFLTWKMWYSFTVEEQETMLKDTNKEHKREILTMLYLFVVNRDEDNSQQCEIFKNNIKDEYKKVGTSNEGYSLADIIINWGYRKVEILRTIIDTFDTCLLDIPVVFKDLNKYDLGTFLNFLKRNLFSEYHIGKSDVLMYKSHVCYAFTKFTQEIGQINSSEQSDDVKINSRLYFDPKNIKLEFRTWIKTSGYNNKLSDAVFLKDYRKEFVNAFAMIRQITQSEEYNCDMFLKIFDSVNLIDNFNKPYFTLLFSLTSENILKEWVKTQKWVEYIKNRSTASHNYQYLENIFVNNANNSLILRLNQNIYYYIIKIHGSFSKLNIKKNAMMHREYYFYQRLLFHPRSIMFNNIFMLSYIEGLSKIGRLNSKEQCDQIARDLVFSEYYHEAVMKLKDEIVEFEKEPSLVEFKNSLEKEYNFYKNKEAIETERLMFRKC